jgi:hypothetical protein
MEKGLQNFLMFLAICFVSYITFSNLNLDFKFKEGMTTSTTTSSTSSSTSGIAGNAAAYAASIKSATIKMQDTFLFNKYHDDYEKVILDLDDLINCLMLNITLNVDTNNPQASLSKLAELNQAKTALNSVMKFVDKSG